MKNKINPVGLKGNEINERMKQLMGIQPINENRKTSVVELTKLGPDGHVYGIVRENHEYYIKVANKKENLVAEDFGYIGGLKNKKSEAYSSYAKAIKHLNLKFNSLNEAFGKTDDINVFENDNLMSEDIAGFSSHGGSGFKNEGNLEHHNQSECCNSPIMEGKCSSCGNTITEGEKKGNPWAICTSSVGRADKAKYEACVKDIKKKEGINESITEADYEEEGMELSEVEQEVEDMMETEDVKVEVKEGRLSIKTSLKEMDNIIEDVVSGKNKKKVYTLK